MELLLSEMDDYQFGQFSSFFSKGANAEILFIQKYRKMDAKIMEGSWYNWDRVLVDNELEYYGRKYWETRILAALRITSDVQNAKLLNICTKVAQFVVDLDVCFAKWNANALENLALLTNVRYITLDAKDDTDVAKILSLCKKYTLLEKITILFLQDNKNLLPSLKELLEFKMYVNKRVVLMIGKSLSGSIHLSDVFSYLGEALHGLSGLNITMCTADYGRKFDLSPYSRVACIKELQLLYLSGTEECLLDVIRHAPPCKNENYAISRLRFLRCKISTPSYTAFQHWRFSRLEYFSISRTRIGHDEAALLAEHASFWPFVKEVSLHSCRIPSSGFLLLLPAMVRGRGCENLVKLDFSMNDCTTLETFNNFFSSDNLTKLNALCMGNGNTIPSIPSEFLTGIQKLPLLYLNMEYLKLGIQQIYQLLCCILSKSDVQLQEIKVNISPFSQKRARSPQSQLNCLLRNCNTPCLQSVRVYTTANGTCRIVHGENEIKLYIRRT